MRSLAITFIAAGLFFQSCAQVSQGPGTGENEIPGYNNHDVPGASAKDLLTSADFTKLVVEIQSVGTATLTVEAQNNLKNFLEAHLNKPDGIEIAVDLENITGPAKTTYSFDDILQMEKNNRIQYTDVNNDKIVIYVILLDKPSENDTGSSKLFGLAYQNTSIALFENTIQSLSGGLTEPSTAVVESTVLQHEAGHLMGLVNIGTPTQSPHQDTAHGAHCSTSTCLMYYTANTNDILTNLLGGSIPALDSKCEEDLTVNGGK